MHPVECEQYYKAERLLKQQSYRFFVRASPVGFATGMNEIRYAFSQAGLMGARPLPEIYCFIYLTSGFASIDTVFMDFSKKKLILAPLAGITDTVFRCICKEHGADIVVSEMVSAEGLFYKSKMTESLVCFKECERPIGIQLFGSNPDHLAYAADFVQKKVNPDFIDLNSGCPAPKIAGKNGGSCLLKDIKLFFAILSTMAKAISIPLTVKIRSGWFEHEWVDVEFAQAAQSAGVSAITVHPRSKTMGFSGHSYWERIALVKQAVSIPVIGNGDVLIPDDAMKMFSDTGCDSIMIGRGALGNPWLFSQIRQTLDSKPVSMPTAQDKIDTAINHVHTFLAQNGERQTVCDCKKHASWYLKGLVGASMLRSRIFTAESTAEILEALKIAQEMQDNKDMEGPVRPL